MKDRLGKFLHHFVCNIAWSWPYIVDCNYANCGNWKESARHLKER